MKKDKLIAKLPKGWIDTTGSSLARKKKIIKIIEDNFINFGFSALETPFAEISENIGSFLASDSNNPMSDVYSFQDGNDKLTIKYDNSAPLARFYAERYRELPSIFRRYQIDRVARNEKFDSKKIKLKSFTQADADIVGVVNKCQANSELINLIADTFFKLGFESSQFKICISNRKIIEGFINDLKISDEKKKMSIFRALDKLGNPNIGKNGVRDLLGEKRIDSSGAVQMGADLSESQINEIMSFLEFKNLDEISSNIKNSRSKEGIEEMKKLLEVLSYGKYANQVKLSLAKVRGIFYYTGWTVETELNLANWAGISPVSGGEYGNLISRFKNVDVPGVGISFGIERVMSACEAINMTANEPKPVLVCVMQEKYLQNYYEILENLRSNNINSEIFLDTGKNMVKQMKYANKRGCPVAVICGENEFNNNTITLKNLLSEKGDLNQQTTISKDNLINEVRKILPKNN